MSHLNCLSPRAAGVNFWFFIAVPFGGGCWYKAKCEMRDAATQDRRWNECAKLWIFREIAKWRRWRHAPWLTATAVITDSRHRFSKRWHVADVKTIARDDQATLIVHRNSANIACTFRLYVCLYLRDRDCFVPRLTAAAFATHPHHRTSKRWHNADVKNFTGDDQATLMVDQNSAIWFIYVYTIAAKAPAAAPRLTAASVDRLHGMYPL